VTARGDVLAMMDALLAFASRGVESDDPARPMIERGHEARAAVAELIEAVKAAVTEEGMAQDELDRLRAALARVGGAS